MPHVTTDDGVKLHYEEAGDGHPDRLRPRIRRRPPQLRAADALLLAALPLHRLQCARLPALRRSAEVERYSQARARDDIRAVMDATEDRQGARRRPLDGRVRHAALRHALSAMRARSLVIGGLRLRRGTRQAAAVSGRGRRTAAQRFDRHRDGRGRMRYALGPTRVQLQNKDPRGWREFAPQLAEHSAPARRNTHARRAEAAALRSTTSSTRWRRSPCRRW